MQFSLQCLISIAMISILLLQDVSSKYILMEIETSPNGQDKRRYVASVDDMNDMSIVAGDHADQNVPQDNDDTNMNGAAHVQLVNRIYTVKCAA